MQISFNNYVGSACQRAPAGFLRHREFSLLAVALKAAEQPKQLAEQPVLISAIQLHPEGRKTQKRKGVVGCQMVWWFLNGGWNRANLSQHQWVNHVHSPDVEETMDQTTQSSKVVESYGNLVLPHRFFMGFFGGVT